MLNKLLKGSLVATLVGTSALAHTNSVGYVGDGNGNLTVWYGSWHDNTQFNEAELKVVDSNNVKLSQKQFDLLSQDSPAGLISGVNYFTSDGTQLQPYDPNTPHPQGMPNESYTWQGATFQLAPGNYTFVYIPLGDAESTLPGSPTAEWVPMDEVIRSLSITLTQGDIDGDANNNGILDINEVAVGAASGTPVGPTVVSQGSSTVIGYVATADGVIQIVQRTQTDTTWDNMSDGTTTNTQSTSTTLDPYIGRIDQVRTAAAEMENINFRTDFIGKLGDSFYLGVTKQTENGLALGFGRVQSEDITKTGVSLGRNGFTVHAAMIEGEYDYERTIGTFTNAGATTEDGYEVGVMYEPNMMGLSPIVGAVMSRSTVEGWDEKGSVQTALSFASVNNSYNLGTLGAEYNTENASVSARYHTNNIVEASVIYNNLLAGITRDIDAGKNSFSLGVYTRF